MSDVSPAPVAVENFDGTARITLNVPPVNALGSNLRTSLFQALQDLAGNDLITSVLLVGQPRAFSAGADIKEFGGTRSKPSLRDIVAAIEDFPKPVVAGLSGVALGGGLELAMAAHARIAEPGAVVGLPEITLGLIPGAGGTVRLPRLVGPARALEIMMTGQHVSAAQAREDGLIDALLDSVFDQKAVDWTKEFASGRFSAHAHLRADLIAEAQSNPGQLAQLAEPWVRKAKDPLAAKAIVTAVTAGIEESFTRGSDVELEQFETRRTSPESAAQRYLFAAVRAARKPAGLDIAAAHPVTKVGVIGAGTMGGGIALAFAAGGIPVTLVETAQDALDRGLAQLESNLSTSVAKGTKTEAAAASQRALIMGSLDYADLADADLVIEAAFEDMSVKHEIFSKLDRHVSANAVLASNTSYLDIEALAAETAHPERVVGMHFFSPAHVMPLVEVIRGDQTSAPALATVVETARIIGKTPVVVGVCHGFVGNRMLRVRTYQAEQLLLEGCLPGQVDRILTEFGFRMGPFAMGDMAGLDIGWRTRKSLGEVAPVSDALCEAGRLGQKTGAGYYVYDGRKAQDDPVVEQIINEASGRLGIVRREFSDQEILERLIYPMINEATRILQEGIAERASDIDVIWAKGYNWPIYRGGPIWHADQIGLAAVADRLDRFANQTGDESLRPTPLLRSLAATGRPLTGYSSSLDVERKANA